MNSTRRLAFLALWTLCCASFALANPLLPERIAVAEVKEETYFRAFGLFIQMENGDFTTEKGCVLIVKQGEDFELAFYRKDGAEFVRVDGTVKFQGTRSPHASALQQPAVPCITAIKKDGTGRLHAFIARGKLGSSESAP